ncbi:hypothetical protein F5B20DRAFT_578052 [Whalleya microplaca]|nr:hypothetical protein F5B20DRAFT_578052 [Whalleya microplaca]
MPRRQRPVFSGTTKLTNTSPIRLAGGRKPSAAVATAIAVLHDHDFFLHCDPHYTSHKVLPPTDDGGNAEQAKTTYKLPTGIEPLGSPAVQLYEVVDHVPNPVWSSNVVSREEFADFAEGLWVRIHSPLGVVMETTWKIRERTGGGEGLELVEDVEISCSKLLLGIVKGQVEGNWKGIHQKLIARIVEEVEKAGDGGA